jgi:4,4'-diaponeurosporenoate glycosyltransferase
MPAIETAWLAVRFAAGCGLLWSIRRPRRVQSSRDRAAVSIIVPARNEEATLPALLASLDGELRKGDEVIVVDDHSTDATATLAPVVAAPPLPPGWTGKAWACSTGAQVASNDVLVFLDADVTVLDGGLDRVLAAHAELAPDGLLSVQPYHVTVRLHERLSAFFNTVSMMGTDAFTVLGRRRSCRGAFGPCLVTSRTAYDAVGGHASVSSSILDDVALAGRYAHSECLAGRGSLTFRMYPGGLGQLVEGWTKNIASGARVTRPSTLLVIVLWLSLCIEAAWWLVIDRDATAIAIYALVVVQLGWMLRRIGRFGVLTPALYPVPLAWFLGVFVRSSYLTLIRRRVRWKGRAVAPGP